MTCSETSNIQASDTCRDRVRRRVLATLDTEVSRAKFVMDVAAAVYGVASPAEHQRSSVRRALRSLEAEGRVARVYGQLHYQGRAARWVRINDEVA